MNDFVGNLSSALFEKRAQALGHKTSEKLVDHVFTTKDPVRLSRNRNSEYLPQRRKGRKVRRWRVKIIYKSCCPFPITLAPWREEFQTPSTFDARLFAQAAQIFNYSNTKVL